MMMSTPPVLSMGIAVLFLANIVFEPTASPSVERQRE
jgi:hypothetical protein